MEPVTSKEILWEALRQYEAVTEDNLRSAKRCGDHRMAFTFFKRLKGIETARQSIQNGLLT